MRVSLVPGLAEIVVEYPDTDRLLAEFERDLRKGRAFAHGARGVQARDLCAVTLIHPPSGERCELTAEAVWVQSDGPGVGVGVQFDQTDERWLGKLEAFVGSAKLRVQAEADAAAEARAAILGNAELSAALAATRQEQEASTDGDTSAAHTAMFDDEDDWGRDENAAPEGSVAPGESSAEADDVADTETEGHAAPNEALSEAEKDEHARREARRSENLFDRIRALKPQEAQKVARQGTLPERVALERSFGGAVWEGLLQNPSITGQEVAKISKKGSLPKPVLSLIVANAAWVAIPEVQRALLSNPRLGAAGMVRVLQALSQSDLKRMSKSTAYSHAVRAAAGKLVKKI
jgi:hypothetical protein